MKTVYLSSTYEDLKDFRNAVSDVLRNCGYGLTAMEQHYARDARPLDASLADVQRSDIYIGVFAWRYGYIPAESSRGPGQQSITELEYLAARGLEKPRLIFLLSDDAPWPSSLRDAEQEEDQGQRIRDLRMRLRTETWVGFFKSPDDLAKQVLTSVIQLESTRRPEHAAMDDIRTTTDLGASYLPNIQQQLESHSSAEILSVMLGSTHPWWNTRLHLAAALASDFTEIRQFVLVDTSRRFLVMAPPVEIRRAFVKAVPKLEVAYIQSREKAQGISVAARYYPEVVRAVFGQDEVDVKQEVTPAMLRELGIRQQAEVLEIGAERGAPPISEFLRRVAPYVVLVRDGRLEGVVDRLDLASRIAVTTLA